jgi:carbonic anhydrase
MTTSPSSAGSGASAGSATSAAAPSGSLLNGIRAYHAHSAERLRSQLAPLVDGQSPRALFVTCVDSRVLPDVITGSGPGDLVSLRNPANIIPPYDASTRSGADPFDVPSNQPTDLSVAATLEFAVAVLRVPHVVVCGHSDCAALRALRTGATSGSTGWNAALGRWLRFGSPSLRRWRGGDPIRVAADRAGWKEGDQLALVHVAQQIEHLASYPGVARAVRAGHTKLVGLYFDFATARVHALHPSGDHFDPVT